MGMTAGARGSWISRLFGGGPGEGFTLGKAPLRFLTPRNCGNPETKLFSNLGTWKPMSGFPETYQQEQDPNLLIVAICKFMVFF